MARHYHQLITAFVALVTIALLAPSAPSFGQPGGSEVSLQIIELPSFSLPDEDGLASSLPSTTGPASDPAQTNKAFLPLIKQSISVDPLLFAAEIDKTTGALINPTTAINKGPADLYVGTKIYSAKGSKILFRWLTTFQGVPKTIEGTDSVSADTEYIVSGICSRQGTFIFGCSGSPLAFDQQVMRVQIFADGVLVKEGTLEIK